MKAKHIYILALMFIINMILLGQIFPVMVSAKDHILPALGVFGVIILFHIDYVILRKINKQLQEDKSNEKSD